MTLRSAQGIKPPEIAGGCLFVYYDRNKGGWREQIERARRALCPGRKVQVIAKPWPPARRMTRSAGPRRGNTSSDNPPALHPGGSAGD